MLMACMILNTINLMWGKKVRSIVNISSSRHVDPCKNVSHKIAFNSIVFYQRPSWICI